MSVYQDRIQGTDRLLRIRRMKKAVYAALTFLALLLIYARFQSEGASLVPFYLPLNGLLEVGMTIGLLAALTGFYLRNLEIKSVERDSQRYLMTKYSMSRAMTTAVLVIGIAIILLLPMSSQALGSVVTEPAVYYPVNGLETLRVNFTSPDALGVTAVTSAAVSAMSGSVRVSLLRDGRSQYTTWLNASQSKTIPVSSAAPGLANWTLVFQNAGNGGAIVSLVLQKAVMPTLFTSVPFLLLLYGAANIGWWIGLRPIRDRTKSAALYAGGATEADMGERTYVEYAMTPTPQAGSASTPLAAMAPPPPPPPTPVPPPPAVLPAATTAPRPEPRPAAPRVDTPESLVAKGDSLVHALQYSAALIAFDEALRLYPRHVPALLAKAGAHQALNQDAEALEAYRRVRVSDPGNEDALRASARLLAGQTRWRECLEVVETFLRRRPNDPAVLELKGDVLSSLGRRPEALAAYEAAQALDPSNGNVKQKIEEVRVDVPGLLSRALIASASGNYAQALNLFDDILEVEPSNVNALIGKAVAYRRSGKLQEALNCLDLVLNIQPNNAAALLNRGNLHVERGDFDAALETYDKLVTLAPADEEAWAAQADVFVRVGRDDDALRAYAEALKLNPGDEEIPKKIRELEESRSVHADVLQELYKVKGIGPARAKALVDAGFKTAEDFHHATAEQLLAVKGITKRIAEDLVKHFKGALVEAR
ncbi:MAG: tetratricopeptide repeat protein [Thermoplasmata archaeon]